MVGCIGMPPVLRLHSVPFQKQRKYILLVVLEMFDEVVQLSVRLSCVGNPMVVHNAKENQVGGREMCRTRRVYGICCKTHPLITSLRGLCLSLKVA